MKYLVTGGLGFIGSNLVDKLVEEGHDVSVIDNLSTGKRENKNENVQYHIFDINNADKMLEVSKGVDAIFHLAALARVQRSIDDPIGTNKANVNGTLVVLNTARLNNIERVIYSSSSSVYGKKENPIMQEDMLVNPEHPYGLQKLIGELYCQMFSRLFDVNTICLRYFNVYGKRQVTEGDYALVIGKFLRHKKEGKKMTVYGDGTQTRAYTHVSDVVNANIAASKYKLLPRPFSTFNIGTGVETSINEIVKLLGGDAEYLDNPRGKFEELRKAADFTRARTLLGWEPKVTIEEGIKELL